MSGSPCLVSGCLAATDATEILLLGHWDRPARDETLNGLTVRCTVD